MAGSYKDLRAWKQGVNLALEVYRTTQNLLKAELYGLISQMRRAAVSVASNIAERKGRSTDKEFAVFLFFCHARGSLLELETQIVIAHQLGYLQKADFEELDIQTAHLAKKINALLNVVRGEPERTERTER